MRITTWNVNSLRTRLPQILGFLDTHAPDILCVQEIKCLDDQVPGLEFAERGYQLVAAGQKTYNGVAIAARSPITGVLRDLPWGGDPPARGISAVVGGIRFVDVYVPNGQSIGTEAYMYKLAWLERLQEWLADHLDPAVPIVLCGDFNICPIDDDVYDPAGWRDRIFCSPAERGAFQAIERLGFVDALRHLTPGPGNYTWWDYRQGMLRRNLGLRIDHFLVAAGLLHRVKLVEIHKDVRTGANPSDHAPVSLVLA